MAIKYFFKITVFILSIITVQSSFAATKAEREIFELEINSIVASYEEGNLSRSDELVSKFRKFYNPYFHYYLADNLLRLDIDNLANEGVRKHLFLTKVKLIAYSSKAGNESSQYLLKNSFYKNYWAIENFETAILLIKTEMESNSEPEIEAEYRLLLDFFEQVKERAPKTLFGIAFQRDHNNNLRNNGVIMKQLLLESASKGYLKAQKYVADRYKDGSSRMTIKKDLEKALYWYRAAAKQGDEESVLYIEDITACMINPSICEEYHL